MNDDWEISSCLCDFVYAKDKYKYLYLQITVQIFVFLFIFTHFWWAKIYLYLSKKLDQKIFVFVFAKKSHPKYIRIRTLKLYLSHIDYRPNKWKLSPSITELLPSEYNEKNIANHWIQNTRKLSQSIIDLIHENSLPQLQIWCMQTILIYYLPYI